MKNILVATDLSARSDRAIHRALNLAREFQAKLTILCVIDEDNPKNIHQELSVLAKKQIMTVIDKNLDGVDYKIEIVTGIPHIQILTTSLKAKADLVILGLHRHHNHNNSVMGAVLSRVVKESLKPILVVKELPKFEYKKILVATDFNSHSKNSLKLALQLFPQAGFTMLHSYYMPILASSKNLEDEHKDNCQADMERILKEAISELHKADKKATSPKYKITQKLEKGAVLDVLNNEIIKAKPQLLVIGTFAHTGIARALSLNVAEEFLLNPPCDILVAH